MKKSGCLFLMLVLGISQGGCAQKTVKEPIVERPLFLSAGRIKRNSLTSSFQMIMFREERPKWRGDIANMPSLQDSWTRGDALAVLLSNN